MFKNAKEKDRILVFYLKARNILGINDMQFGQVKMLPDNKLIDRAKIICLYSGVRF